VTFDREKQKKKRGEESPNVSRTGNNSCGRKSFAKAAGRGPKMAATRGGSGARKHGPGETQKKRREGEVIINSGKKWGKARPANVRQYGGTAVGVKIF